MVPDLSKFQIGLMDDDFTAWLRSMSEDGLLDDTVLIVMAGKSSRSSD